MPRFKVTAPEHGFTGESAGVYFKDGVAHVDAADAAQAAALQYFRRRGYGVESADPSQPAAEDDASPARPKDYAAKAEWVAYAVTQGADPDEAEAMTKAELVDQYGKTSNEEELS